MPSLAASSRIASSTAPGSAVAVCGEKIARSQVFTLGSIRRASASVMLSNSTPLAAPRRSNSSICG